MYTYMRIVALSSLAAALSLTACVVKRNHAKRAPAARAKPAPLPPRPVAMDAGKALGLWHSNFGPVKIEQDSSRGKRAVMGVWVYKRSGQEVIGFFSGNMRGNVLEFTWNEPSVPRDLMGAGYLTFDPEGGRFSGRWWTHDRTRDGLWSGWRGQTRAKNPGYGSEDIAPDRPEDGYPRGAYGNRGYGGSAYAMPR